MTKGDQSSGVNNWVFCPTCIISRVATHSRAVALELLSARQSIYVESSWSSARCKTPSFASMQAVRSKRSAELDTIIPVRLRRDVDTRSRVSFRHSTAFPSENFYAGACSRLATFRRSSLNSVARSLARTVTKINGRRQDGKLTTGIITRPRVVSFVFFSRFQRAHSLGIPSAAGRFTTSCHATHASRGPRSSVVPPALTPCASLRLGPDSNFLIVRSS